MLLRDPETFLASVRKQLALLDDQTARTVTTIEQQSQARDLLPVTKSRCLAMIDAVRAQAADIRAVLTPFFAADVRTTAESPASTVVPAPLTYIHYLYRDWGWPADPNGENERVLAAVQSVLKYNRVGQMLVLGAGACRLAYDLHRSATDSETVVLDIDPFLFATAHTVIRGGSVTIREANAEIHDCDCVVKEWVLRAPHGSIAEDSFHFLLADGLEVPFMAASFDTILTPWFIDIVPKDLRNLISEIHRLLRPGGRWINVGPLHYRSEVPVGRRFAREEIFDLAALAGFHVDSWRSESMPYLVSKLNGRGKVEWVLSFSATKLETSREGRSGSRFPNMPPTWLLFPHVAIPVFPGQLTFSSEDPAERFVASAIDGHNTIDDIALLLASQAGDIGLTIDQMREVVRRCLTEIHPELKSDHAG
jgi:ubiquinone/menaquinone biosynthesis C-methylase UbiE